jgi:hypothetical protein
LGDRVLLKDQTSASENGIYVVVASGAASRATDFDSLTPIDEINGAYVPVQEGTANQGKFFVQSGTVATLDTDDIDFVFFNSAATLSGGDGIDITSNTISVDHDGEGLTIATAQLALELDGSTLSKSASGVKVADGGIANTQVSASAAIQFSKMEDLTASRALVSDGSGDVSVSSVTSTELGHVSGVTSAIQTQLDAKLENLSEDTTPSLGGDLTLGSNVVIHDSDGMKRGTSSSDFLEEEYIHSISLLASQTGTAISALTFAHASFEGLEVTYKMKEATSNDVRIGTLRVATNGTNVVLNDVSTETADTGITFSAAVNGS